MFMIDLFHTIYLQLFIVSNVVWCLCIDYNGEVVLFIILAFPALIYVLQGKNCFTIHKSLGQDMLYEMFFIPFFKQGSYLDG